MVSTLAGRGLGPPFWLPGISSLPLLWTSTAPPPCVCARVSALRVGESEEEPSRRKKRRRRRGREEDGPPGTGPFAVIRLLKIVAFIALIFVLISV